LPISLVKNLTLNIGVLANPTKAGTVQRSNSESANIISSLVTISLSLFGKKIFANLFADVVHFFSNDIIPLSKKIGDVKKYKKGYSK